MVVSEESALMSESDSGSGLKRDLGLVIPPPPLPPKEFPENNSILEYSRKRFKKSPLNHQSTRNNDDVNKQDSLREPPTSHADADCVLFADAHPAPTNNVLHAALPVEKVLGSDIMFSPNASLDASNHIHPIEEEQHRNNPSGEDLVVSPSREKPISNVAIVTRRFTRSALTSNPTIGMDPKTTHPRELVVSLRSSNAALDEISGLHESSTKQPLKCSVRSTLTPRAAPASTKFNHQEHNVFLEKSLEQATIHCVNKDTQNDALRKSASSDIGHVMQLLPVNTNNDVHKTQRTRDSQNELSGQVGTESGNRIVTDDCNDENYASANVSQRRFTRSSLQCTTQPMIIKGTMDAKNALDSDVAKVVVADNGESKGKSCEPQGINEARKIHKALLETPPRRFTRLALQYKEKSGIMHGNSEGQSTLPEVICPVRTPHKKLEMKMSKKIALTNFPTTISELLETGMLEGLSVTYTSQTQKNGGLRGLVKDSGILCFCTLCKGRKVVTSSEFKRHAGGSNRNFACRLYLDNGNTFRHVLNVCKDAPLDMLEATIQMAIEHSSVKMTVCLNCKRSLPARRSMFLCKSCLELKKSETSSASTAPVVTRSKTLGNPTKFDDPSKVMSPRNKSTGGKLTRKDLGLHKLVFEKDGLPDGTELGYYVRGKKLLEGYKKGFGIFCFCCNSEISPSQFEAHAGWATRRKPYLHIYTSNGVSLHELSVSLSKGRELSAKDNDDLCGICADYGDLLLCDGCPRAFHKDCVGQLSIPSGKWYCPYCQNVHKDQYWSNNANAVAAGRVSGVDPIEQISKRCIRIVKTPETEIGGCTLCRIPGFSKSGFGPRTIILCDQCEKEFHVGCLRDYNMVDLQELPKGKWFCCRNCSRINCELQKCVIRGPEELPDSITKLIKMKRDEPNNNIDISWRLLNGKLASPESRSLLSKAVAIFHNCFDPIVDAVTGRDLIPCMVYGRNIREQDFGGMFCAVLTLNSSVVSAGLLRIFGQEFAELPLVATSSDYQGQGYFQSLFSCIERLLGYLEVKHLVLPAAEEAEAIWTKKFGFQRLSNDQMAKYTKDHQMTIFRETPMLHKLVPKCRITRITSGRS